MRQEKSTPLFKSTLIISVILVLFFSIRINYIITLIAVVTGLFDHFFIGHMTYFETIFLGVIPLLVYALNGHKKIKGQQLFRMSLSAYIIIALLFFIGALFCVYFSQPSSPLLPKNIAIQPFQYFWAVLMALSLGINYLLYRLPKKVRNEDILDGKH